MASSTRVDPNPNKKYVDNGLALINAYINDYKSSPVPLSNDTIYKNIEEDLKKLKDLGPRYRINNVELDIFVDDQSNTKTDKNIKKLLKIIKKLLDILKPYSLVDDLRRSLFTSSIYDENKPPKTEKKRIQVLLYKSLIEGDHNLNYITNIITNNNNSFLAIENVFAELNTIGKSNPLPELEPKIDERIEKRIKPMVFPVAGAGTVSPSGAAPEPAPVSGTGNASGAAPVTPSAPAPASGAASGGKNKKRNKKTNKKPIKKHRNKTSKHK
jgi:hypothetical protein